ncbi:SCP2 sterol-binding domain-containing protein (plasmid) [Mycolicibacterium rufum]|uniref:SCP2 sterol-binding domain-containing protein n=1 Tax=Mycolicibacterium rufum TaxID=318424 RepID=A0A9X2YBJ5_9MYCO|nr:SCP2 sterol-binding domain-containing protein [Mycolicibacterium rufum]MCV7070459.1 SCP2 sterol-binding domain-containing protein [Mycolicibacterium rufum]UVY95970.1 SCP2 sterol-binding domain-containing protein [Mycolicibacterium rufum]
MSTAGISTLQEFDVELEAVNLRGQWVYDEMLESVVGGPNRPIEGHKPDFVLTATAAVWRRVSEGEVGVASAIATRKIKFVGPIKVAMAHMAVLSAGLSLVGQVDGLVWGD